MTVPRQNELRVQAPCQQKRVLITGIAGFCGSHLAESLLDHAQGVTGLETAGAITSNIRPILDRIQLHRVDVREADQLRRILAKTEPDHIYHLAGVTGHGNQAELRTIYEVNLQGTINLLEAITALGLDSRILIAGSSAQYGQAAPDENPLHEVQAFRPITHYAISKTAQDLLGFRYWATTGTHVIRARTFNIVGPRQSPKFAASAFAKQIAEIEAGQKPPILFVGNLEAARDFVDVRDVVRAYQLLVETGEPGEAYNVCSGQAHSIRSLLEQLLDLSTVREIEVRQDSARVQQADVPIQVGDYSKLFERTGWQPSITLKQSIRDLLDYWRQRVKEED
jgi:GDP-4-dehydro-6-deoxy-D-mannose reductase